MWPFECGREYYVVKIRWYQDPDIFRFVAFDNRAAAKRQFEAWLKRAIKFTGDQATDP
jgi:hypothetical protein